MRDIALQAVSDWRSVRNCWIPTSVNITCPFCGTLATFTLTDLELDGHRNSMAACGKCPKCSETARFWVIDPGPADDTSKKGCAALCIYPPFRPKRAVLEGAEKIPFRIQRAYQDAVDSYNASLWSPCGSSCRRTLEGIVQDLMEHEEVKPNLAQQLGKLPEHVDLSSPLIELAHGLREGGNLAAHFDLEKEPDEEVASAMLDMLEYFIEYVYLLSKRAEKLSTRIRNLPKAVSTG